MRVKRMPQRGITLNINESGTARLLFRRDRIALSGVLETDSGETISVTGKLIDTSPETSPSPDPVAMEFMLVDGEAGSSFRLDSVDVFVERNKISINNPAITFSTKQRVYGDKADVIIHQYMNPSMIDDKQKEVFIGPMKLHLAITQPRRESIRRESISEQGVILEQSDDFLA